MIPALIITALTLTGAATALLIVLRRRYVSVRIEGDSMEPTLSAGQRVLVRRTRPDRVRRGQIVVLAFPPGSPTDINNPPWLIKRVAAVPGDPVPREKFPALRHVPGSRVPPGRLVLLSDNRTSRYDSRRNGYFAADNLLGVVRLSEVLYAPPGPSPTAGIHT